MQSNKITIQPGQTINLPVQGNGFWFESGTSTTADLYIIVKPDAGAEFRLKPGQHVQDVNCPTGSWRIAADDPTATITGQVIIGSGDFADNNTLNKVTLDATFANIVTVNNTPAQRVPVTLDTAQSIGINNTTANRVPVTLDTTQVLNINSGSILSYTASYASSAQSVAVTAINLLPAASNVNGAILNKFDVNIGNPPCLFTVLAKATAPTSLTDGDVLFSASPQVGGITSMDIGKAGQPKIAAGKGIWYISNVGDSSVLRNALFTVL